MKIVKLLICFTEILIGTFGSSQLDRKIHYYYDVDTKVFIVFSVFIQYVSKLSSNHLRAIVQLYRNLIMIIRFYIYSAVCEDLKIFFLMRRSFSRFLVRRNYYCRSFNTLCLICIVDFFFFQIKNVDIIVILIAYVLRMFRTIRITELFLLKSIFLKH